MKLFKNLMITLATLIVLGAITTFVYVRYFIGSVGPDYLYSFPSDNLQVLFHEVDLDSNIVQIQKVLHAPKDTVSLYDSQRFYCVAVTGFPETFSIDQKKIWREFADLDSTHLKALEFVCPASSTVGSEEYLNYNSESTQTAYQKVVARNRKWKLKFSELDSSYFYAFKNIFIEENQIRSLKLWIYDRKNGYLRYYDY